MQIKVSLGQEKCLCSHHLIHKPEVCKIGRKSVGKPV